MKIEINNKAENYIAVFLTLVYAVLTRTIFARFLFQTQIQLLLYYAVTYLCLVVGFMRAFDTSGGHLYAPKGFFGVLMIAGVVTYGLFVANDISSLLYYGMAFLLPFSLLAEIKESISPIRIYAVFALITVTGSLFNYLFPSVYSAMMPLFYSGYSLSSVQWLAREGAFYPGIFSQVNYVAFFLGIAIGAVYNFRKIVFRKTWLIIEGILMFGMLLSGKRGAFVYVIAALLLMYFLEGRGREKFFRVIKIAAIVVMLYCGLAVIANYSKIPSVVRIYDTVNTLIFDRTADDTGRTQLQEKALEYFQANPVLGIGWRNFKNLFSLRNTYVHCIYLQLLCETGIVGTTIFIIFFAKNVMECLKKYRWTGIEVSCERAWIGLALFSQVYFLLFGLTENPIYDIEEMIVYMFFIGVGNMPIINSQMKKVKE